MSFYFFLNIECAYFLIYQRLIPIANKSLFTSNKSLFTSNKSLFTCRCQEDLSFYLPCFQRGVLVQL